MSSSDQRQQGEQHHSGSMPPPTEFNVGGSQQQQGNYAQGYGRQSTSESSNAEGKLQWVSASNKSLPPNPVQGGIEDNGKPLFIARVMYGGGLHPGKFGQHLSGGGCAIGYGNKEIYVDEYQVLCGDASKLRWVRQDGVLNINGFTPFPAGHEDSGEPLYVAKTLFDNSQQLGKCGAHIKKGMSFPYGHKEKTADDYMVLAYAD